VAAWLALTALAMACGGSADGAGAKLVVNSTLDTDERDEVLTLREAVLLAIGQLAADGLDEAERGQLDGSPGSEGADTIIFDEATFTDEEPKTIALDSGLPPMDRGGDAIDGANAVIIEGQDPDVICLTLRSDANELLGLRIHNCQTAVLVWDGAVGNVIGKPGEGNVLSGNVVGVEVQGEATAIKGNIIGLDAAGTSKMANEFEGIWLTKLARDTVIGGAGEGEGNVISGNNLFGVSVDGARGTVLQGNTIGLDKSGETGIANLFAIMVQSGARETLVGGDADGEGNVIAGNTTAIVVRHERTEENTVRGNYFGTDISGERAIPNSTDISFLAGAGEALVEDNVSLGPLKIEKPSP
jgi:parallel beta-helix repeat protein